MMQHGRGHPGSELSWNLTTDKNGRQKFCGTNGKYFRGHPRTSLAPGIQQPLHATAEFTWFYILFSEEQDRSGKCVSSLVINKAAECGVKQVARQSSLFFLNFCFKNDATEKTWLNTWKFQHKPRSGDALNLFHHWSDMASAMVASPETSWKDRQRNL